MGDKQRTNWKQIAMELMDRVDFAMHHCDFRRSYGTGMVTNNETGKRRWWREYMAEGMEMMPDIKIDRELLAIIDLPAKERRKAWLEIRKRKSPTSPVKEG